jgi:hypothetical protein
MFKHLGIYIAVTTGATDRRDDENIRKIRDIFCLVNIFDFSIAIWTRTRNDSSQL